MRLTLLFLNLKQWRHHKLRALVTVASIAIGVATYFAMRTTNDSLKRSLDQTVDRLSGRATLQVTADESGFPESILATVRSTPGVAAATGVVQFFCRTDLKDQTGLNYQFDRDPRAQLLIVGVDPDNEQKLRPLDPPAGNGWHVNPLLFLRFPGAAVISSTFAHRQGLAAGQMLPILSSKGRVELRVLRVLPPTDSIDGLFGGRVAIMDIHAVQDLVGVGRKLERIDLTTNPEGDIESVRQDLQARLGAGLDVQHPLQRSREIEDASRTVRHGLLLTGLISMLVSAFIIYNAMSLAVGQRWKELGVLRALGVPRAKVRGMFLYEASVLGLIGSALGLIGGYFLAVLAARFTGGISLLLRIALPSNPLSAVAGLSHPAFNVEFAVEAALIGIVLSIASSWAPAQAACQLSPVLALHNIESRQQEKAVGWRRVVFGAAILIWGIALIALTPPVEGGLLQMSYEGLIFLGFIAMLPGLSFWTAASLRPFAGRLLGAEGTLAADSIALAPRRTSATAGAIMVGLAFVFSIWSFMQSQKAIIIGAFDKDVLADLTVATGALVTDDQVAKVAKLPGVRHVGLNRAGSTRYNGLMVSVDACDIAERLSRPGYSLDQGDVTTARLLAPQGKGVLVSTLFAGRWRVHTGDVLRLQSPSGPLDLPVLGVIAANGQAWLEGVIYLDWSAYRQYWNDPRPEWLAVDLDPGADPVTVKGEVLDALYGAPLAFAATAEELNRNLREQVSSNVNQIFLFYYVQMVIATFVAAIGMINTLVISVWDRRREIGIIRAVGGTRRQLSKIVLAEAALLAIVGLVTGTLKGLFDTYFLSRTASVVFGGYSVPFRFPVVLILLSVPIVIGIALAAAWGPARLAAKMNVVTAIGSE